MKKSKKVKYYTTPDGNRVYNVTGITGMLLQYDKKILHNDFIIDNKKLYRIGKDLRRLLMTKKITKQYLKLKGLKINYFNPVNVIKILYHKIVRCFKNNHNKKIRSTLKNNLNN